jgi:hypothetical protein
MVRVSDRNQLGAVSPFNNIVEAERRHIEALADIFDRCELPQPHNTWQEPAPGYDSLAEACADGVAGEIDNGEMYERLLAVTTQRDIIQVFENLQRASRQNHLPAFRRCVSRTSDDGVPDERGDGNCGHRERRRWRGGRTS